MMARGLVLYLVLTAVAIGGCASDYASKLRKPQRVIFVVPGSDGAGWWADGVYNGLGQGRRDSEIQLVRWGMPLGVLANMRFQPLQERAESQLLRKLVAMREERPLANISVVGHSGGCGVILQAMAAAPAGLKLDHVVLLAPAVSESYDLRPALSHVRGTMHVFYSSRDEILPSTWASGTYDNRWSDCAGVAGFTAPLPPVLAGHLHQHAHQAAWADLGCGGGHFGWRSEEFVRRVVAPLLVWPIGN